MKPLLTARDLISFVAFVVTAAEFTYWLGGRTRQAIEAASDALANLWAIAMGAGEAHHYNAVVEVCDMVADALLPASPVEAFPIMAVAAPPAPPAPSAPPEPCTPRPARRRRSSAKTQD